MKRIRYFFIGILFVVCMTVCLTACSGKKEQLLFGTYTAENSSYQISYTFDEKKKVTLRCFSEGALVYSQEGTYGISDDGVLIILSFSPNNASEIPEGLTVQSGEFLFKQENDSIQIGNQEYQRIGTPPDTSLNISEEEAKDNTSAVKQKPLLYGEYSLQRFTTQTSYTFDVEKNVTVRVYVGNFPVYSQQGTYELSDDGDLITFSFPNDPESTGMTVFNGTYSFRSEDDCIWIGSACYQKNGAAEPNTSDTSSDDPAASEEPVKLDNIRLELPQQHSISYSVTEESMGKSRTYTQAMIRTDNGIFVDLGDSKEKYVFELLNSGKFIEYRYNSLTGKYDNPMLSEAVKEQIAAEKMTIDMAAVDANVVSFFTSRVSTFFDYYETYRGRMNYSGQERIGEIDCQKYTANFDSLSGEHSAELWVDPITGLCIKGIYQYESSFGVYGTKSFVCTEMETNAVTLPNYK